MEIEKLKKIIKDLREEEAKSLLLHILYRVNLLKETKYSENEFIDDLRRIYTMIFDVNEQSEMNKEGTFRNVHILFGASPAGSLKVALKDMGVTKGENIISFWDVFSIGPVWRLHEEAGKELRFEWIRKNINNEYDEFHEYKQRFQKTMNEILTIPEGVPVTIWTAENSHEQTGLRFVLHLLKDRNHDIFVINTTKVYRKLFNHRIVKYTVLHSGEIPPEKLQLIYEHSKNKPPLSQHERDDLEKEWCTLAENREELRLWRNGKIHSVSVDYYDPYIIIMAKKLHHEMVEQEFMKSARLIGQVLGHLDQYVGDEFLEYRLRKLIEKGIFEVKGNLKAMRFYSVRLVNF
jgi:hypothetical protein